jgi:hypothetical protein
MGGDSSVHNSFYCELEILKIMFFIVITTQMIVLLSDIVGELVNSKLWKKLVRKTGR